MSIGLGHDEQPNGAGAEAEFFRFCPSGDAQKLVARRIIFLLNHNLHSIFSSTFESLLPSFLKKMAETKKTKTPKDFAS